MILPAITTYPEFEKLKKTKDIFVKAARTIIAKHQLPDDSLTPFDGTNMVFAFGHHRIIKIFPPCHQDQYQSDLLVLKQLQNKLSVQTPNLEHHGIIDNWPYLIMNRLDGTILEGLWEKLDHDNKIIIIRELGTLIQEVHQLPTEGLEAIDSHWEQFISQQIEQCVEQHKTNKLSEKLISRLPDYIKSAKEQLPRFKKAVILTGEYTPMNLLVNQVSGVWHIAGLIDFGDSMLGLPEYDLLGPGVFLIQGDKMLLREFLLAYGYKQRDLTPALSKQLTLLMLLHRYSNLNIQIRIDNWVNKVNNIKELEDLVWGFN